MGVKVGRDAVETDLGVEAAAKYAEARDLTAKGENDGEALEKATELHVEALTAVPAEKTRSAGYGELLLAYGKSLLCFLRRNVEAENVLGEISKRIDKNNENITSLASTPKGETQDDVEEDIEDVDNEELTWEQLETARVIFEGLGDQYKERQADVYETLADFLVETDQSQAAATEYEKAAAVHSKLSENADSSRIIAHLHYQRYLALRRDAPDKALSALKEGVQMFKNFTKGLDATNADNEVLSDMINELKLFSDALAPALAQVHRTGFDKEHQNANAVEVKPVVVKPKRRIVPTPVKEEPPGKKVREAATDPPLGITNGIQKSD